MKNLNLTTLLSGSERSNKAASPTCVASCLPQVQKERCSDLTLERFSKKNDNPGRFSGVAIKHRKLRSKSTNQNLCCSKLLCRDDRNRRRLRHDGSAHVFRIQADHLSRLR